VRLTPKSLFFGLVSIGLPFAVALGWVLGETTTVTPPAAATPDGFGGLGTAPERDKPLNRVDYPERTSGPRSASSTAPVAVPPRTADSSGPSTSNIPAEPSPAEPSASAPNMFPSESAPSATPSAEPPGIDVARVIRTS